MAYGGDQEMIAALCSKGGDLWGALGLYREPDRPMFDDEDLRFVRAISPHLAEGLRRSLLVGEAADPEGPDAPGMVVLNADWELESTSPGVNRWLAELTDPGASASRLPSALLAVAGRAMRLPPGGSDAAETAQARVLTRSGRWLVLHGVSLDAATERRVAVVIEPAHPARIAPLLMAAYGLTAREQDVTRRVLCGDSTAQIAGALCVSPHTVQQHLKNIFDKTGVRSRRDLVGKLFFSHYEPRFRDNEKRVAVGRPVRGGPAVS
jgi:DNA-binding CsgD family transcriptional regulator